MSPSLQIVGAGLLGTSVGLALANTSWEVWIADSDPAAQRLAGELGSGRPGWADADPDLILLCVPPAAIGEVMQDVIHLYPFSTISDVVSIKTHPQEEAEKSGCSDRFVGGHPMAGRERSGPVAAQADLFEARPWALCPSPMVDPSRLALVERLVHDCGADPLVVDAAAHDSAVALVSHLPQVAASAVAGQLGEASALALALAGQGLRDTVRIAGSDAALWSQILAANAAFVVPHVRQLAKDLTDAADALGAVAEGDATNAGRFVDTTIERLMVAGEAGYRRIPGKHGAPAAAYTVVPVVIPDEPGALARLFASVAAAGSSVEDIALEHSPGHPVGVIELSVRPEQAAALVAVLHADGWSSH